MLLNQLLHRRVCLMVVAALTLGMAFPSLILAQPPGKGGGGGGGGGGSPGPTGDVYFQSRDDISGGAFEVSVIKADGSGGATELFPNPAGHFFTKASHYLHGGQRWFLSWGDGLNESGVWVSYVTATSESGVTVPLFVSSDFTFIEGEPHWVRPAFDGWVSFEGSQWSTDPATGARTLGEEGVFRVQVDFAEDGSISGGVPGSMELVLSTLPFDAEPSGHDWGPGGDLLFVTRVQNLSGGSSTQLRMADFKDPDNPLILPVNTGSNQPISSLSWSPEGSKVAFNEHTTGIVILTLANGSRKAIRSNATTGVGQPLWAPSGLGIVYQRTRSSTRVSEVYRAAADGSGQTYLATGRALGWR